MDGVYSGVKTMQMHIDVTIKEDHKGNNQKRERCDNSGTKLWVDLWYGRK